MIKVIKHGKKKFSTICGNCGCEFTYELSDIVGSSVECPDCGHYVVHDLVSSITEPESTPIKYLIDKGQIK